MPRPLRIHHLLNSFDTGGAEVLVVALAQAQREAGHEVVVRAMSGEGAISERLQRAGVPYRIHLSRGAPKRILELTRALRAEHLDVLHCHNSAPLIVGGIAGKLARVKATVVTRHHPSFHGAEDRKFWRAAMCANKVVACSQVVYDEMAKDDFAERRKLVLIQNGAGFPVVEAFGEQPIAKRGVRFISVGRVVWEKDYPTLIEAFAQVRKQAPDAELWIAGDGSERGKVEEAISAHGLHDSVTLLGMKRNAGFYMRQSDVFVLSSVSEGLPVSLLEAMALGMPCVVTGVGGMPSVVRSADCGLIVPKSDVNALAEAMLRMARDGEARSCYATNALKGYEKEFTIAQMARQYEELYLECLRR